MNIKYDLIVTDDEQIIVLNAPKLARQLQKLKKRPGHYKVFIAVKDERLESMKKYYFSMETHLSRHLGCKKAKLHEDIKNHTDIGRKVDPATDDVVYESVADIREPEDMLVRIFEFQQWAATEHNYTFEPYNEEDYGSNASTPA